MSNVPSLYPSLILQSLDSLPSAVSDHFFHSLPRLASSLFYCLVSSLIITHHLQSSFNKYTQICARATRQALKEEERLKSTKRGELSLRYQEWKQGVAGEQVSGLKPVVYEFS